MLGVTTGYGGCISQDEMVIFEYVARLDASVAMHLKCHS